MLIPFAEPTAPRYIYINPANNLLHLLVPIIRGGGDDEDVRISTDNTCELNASLDEFFLKQAALRELNAYQFALEFDLQLLYDGNDLKTAKQQRLNQIKQYIEAIGAIQEDYKEALSNLMTEPSNLYSIQLRPRIQDPESRVINPVFNINRRDDEDDTPLSALYNTIYTAYPDIKMAELNPRTQLVNAVLSALPEQKVDFKAIQQALTEQTMKLFGLEVDFTTDNKAVAVNQEDIDELMGFESDDPGTAEAYIDALLGVCAPEVFKTIPTPPFYSVMNDKDKTEKLSILTQFFLAQVNIYCVANKISTKNFGTILDASDDLSKEVVAAVCDALTKGEVVEEYLGTFFTKHKKALGLSRDLTPKDISSIKKQFNRTYSTVTATKENPHMDDFMILDTTAKSGKFVSHQGSICTDLTELTNKSSDNDFFKKIRSDFEAQYVPVIPHKNEHIKASIDLSVDRIMSVIKDDNQLKKLPIEIQNACLKSAAFQLGIFLHDVAQGKQDEAEHVLKISSKVQSLLTDPGTFTDYSGRTFKCTAYEYAYWAKDKHMCRMLEQHMDENTKATMFKRCEAIENDGLKYTQNGKECCTKHFDLTPLKKALQDYVAGYVKWRKVDDRDESFASWMAVGREQRDVPAHVINEYCRDDRSFSPTPDFDDELPRVVTFYSQSDDSVKSVFPLLITDSSGLGVDFALMRAKKGDAWSIKIFAEGAKFDLDAVSYLDDVRTEDLKQSLDNLKPNELEQTISL